MRIINLKRKEIKMPQHVLFLIFIALILFFIIYPKIKKSRKVNEYAKELLEDIPIGKDVDDKITEVQKGLNELKINKEENCEKKVYLDKEIEKIDKFIGKDEKKYE